jgi:hypothetical protein
MTSNFKSIDRVARILQQVRDEQGTGAALLCAEEIICTCAAIIAWSHGSDEARRVLKLAEEAQEYAMTVRH